MRNKLFILPILILVIAISCNKDAASLQDGTLPGAWKLRSWYGGYSATGGGNLEAGNGNIYVFAKNTYRYYEDNSPRDSGTYTITEGTNPNTGEAMSAVLFDSRYTIPYSIDNNVLTLYFGTVAADGVVNKYARITGAPGSADGH